MARFPTRLSIMSLFTLATLVPLVLVGVLLLLLAVRTVSDSSASLGKDILTQSGDRVEADVRRYLDYARRQSDLLNGLISEGILTAADFEAWIHRFIIRLKVTPEVSSICFTSETLDTVYVMRYPPELELGLGIGHGDGSTMSVYPAYLDGRRDSTPRLVYEYDPRTRPWWQLGNSSVEPVWTPAYQWFATRPRRGDSITAIAYTRAVRDRAGNQLGVLSIDATLEQIENHLASILHLPGAFVVLTDKNGSLVCSSMPATPVPLQPVAALSTSQVPIHRTAAALFGKVKGTIESAELIEVDGKAYWVRQTPLAISQGLEWTMTLAVPDDQLLQGAKTAISWIKLVGTIYLSAAVISAVLLARSVARPFTRLAAFAREIGSGRFEHRVEIASTREFEQLSGALNTMAANLQERVQLMAQKDAAQEASAIKARLIAHVSHEFRTPLNAIIGYGEMLREQATLEGRTHSAHDAGSILRASDHLLTLINNLLDLSRIEAGKMRLDVVRFDVDQLLHELKETFRPVIEANDNVLSVDAGDVGEMVSDPARIKQVLINLLGNAGKFTSKGRIDLSVRAQGADEVVFTVADTGPGMSREQVERLFVPFGQVHSSAKARGAGAGLGMAITRQLCELLGGKIEIKSEEGVGTRIYVTLPRNHRSHGEFPLA